MCLIAAADVARRPTAGRGVGLHVLENRKSDRGCLYTWQWPRLESSIRQTGRPTIAFVSPSDYVSFQLKGSATTRDTAAQDLEYAERFMTAATNVL